MKKVRRLLAIATIVSMLGASLAGCAKQNTTPTTGTKTNSEVTLTMWDNFTTPETSIVFETMIKNFEQKNPGIKVKRNVMKVEDMRNTIKPALTSKKGPDIFYYDSGPGYLGVLAKAGLALDLTPYAGQFGWNKRIPSWINERCSYDGKLYGIGSEIELLGVYYNKKIFKDLGVEIPKTYDEFLSICKKAKEKGITPVLMDDKEQWPGFHLESLFYTIGVGSEKLGATIEGKSKFDDPAFAASLDMIGSLIKDGYTNKDPNAVSYDDTNKEFYAGKGAMRMTGTWLIPGMVKEMGDNVGMFVLPSAKADVKTTAPGGIGAAMVIASGTQYPKEATKLLDYIYSEEAAKIWYENSMIPPVAMDVNGLKVNSLFKDVVGIASNPVGLSFNVDVLMSQKVNDVTKNAMQELIAGKKTGADVVKVKQKAFDEEKAANK